MTASTPSGWPYVEPTDLPVQFPTSSQNLANKLETEVPRNIGGHMYLATNVPSGAASSTQLAQNSTATLWGGVTIASNALVVPIAGLYQILVSGAYSTNGTGAIRAIWCLLANDTVPANAGGMGAMGGTNGNTGGFGYVLTASGLWRLAAGDSVKVMGRQDCGAPLLFTGTLAIRYVHA